MGEICSEILPNVSYDRLQAVRQPSDTWPALCFVGPQANPILISGAFNFRNIPGLRHRNQMALQTKAQIIRIETICTKFLLMPS